MAAVELTVSGVLYDKHARTVQQVVLIGEASLTGLSVGGGPIVGGGGGPLPPTGGGERPAFPIAGPGPFPPGPGYPPVVGGGPIIPPEGPPDMTPPGDKPPPAGAAGWGYYDSRWGYFPAPGDKPQPPT